MFFILPQFPARMNGAASTEMMLPLLKVPTKAKKTVS
jgi:hypothetical protein